MRAPRSPAPSFARAFIALAVTLLLLVTFARVTIAVEPDEMLADPALEARARDISAELRCLVCQNQSIDASDADLAHDLRVLVRERLEAGDSDEQVLQFVVDRYGEFVLLKPVFAWHTLLLWIAAPVILVAGIITIVIAQRRRRDSMAEPSPTITLTDDESAALAALSGDDDGIKAASDGR